MTPGAATRNGQGGGPDRIYSTDHACSLAEKATGVTVSYRQADYWCRNGMFGPVLEQPGGSGSPRRWTAGEVLALAAVGRAASAYASMNTGRSAGSVAMYRHIADQVAAGARQLIIQELTEHVAVVVSIDDIAEVFADAGVPVSP